MIDPAAVATAVVRVAEESLFAWAEPAVADPAAWPAGPWWHASVAFTGPLAGRMDVALPETLGRELLCSFAGLEPGAEISADQLGDFVGEFANMSCGTWLTSLARSQTFTLLSPIVGHADGPPADAPTTVVIVSDAPVVVRASLT
jgi:hypothetical protein